MSRGPQKFPWSNTYSSEVPVRSRFDLLGPIDSTKLYIIDGEIDMGSQSIEVPAGGFNYQGKGFIPSKLYSSEPNYTMFVSAPGGSGDINGESCTITVNGTNSKVYDLIAVDAFRAFEFEKINYLDCTSLGKITDYRQGLEIGTGRLGGTPELELDGDWTGYRITTSIAFNLDAGFTGSLFKAGPTFSMTGRFLTDINADLGSSASLFDFAPSNFPNPSTVQVRGSNITRNGVAVPDDGTITPNMVPGDLAAAWSDNNGIGNTFEGGRSTIDTEVTTTIALVDTFYDLEGTTSASQLEHFDQPANGQIRQLGNTPRDYFVIVDLVIAGTANDQLTIKVVKWDNSASTFIDVGARITTINSLSGPRDVALFDTTLPVTLDQNDYVKIQVANNSGARNITAEIDSFYLVSER